MTIPSPLLEIIKKEALIIDLRSKEEFDKEHIADSLNIPFDSLNSKLLKSNFVKFRKNEAVITCSDKVLESTSAKVMLHSQGMMTVYDGGDWLNLKLLLEAKRK